MWNPSFTVVDGVKNESISSLKSLDSKVDGFIFSMQPINNCSSLLGIKQETFLVIFE